MPRTSPGQALDLSMPVQAPETPGCYRVSYALQGPRGQFGSGFGLIIDVVDPSVTRLSPAELEGALVPASGLGGQWMSSTTSGETKCGEKGGPSETASALFVSPSGIAAVALKQLRTVTQTDSAVVELMPGLPDSVDRAPIDGLGDGAAITWSADTAVGYQFRVGMVLVQVAVAQSGAAHDDTDALARRLADMQEQQLRAALDTGAQS